MLTRREFLRAGLGGAALAAGAPALSWAAAAGKPKPEHNVLFIAVDDLRPVLGCYGYPGVKTPHLDALAKTGTVFNRAYCQLASCCPSRTSLLTGMRIETLGPAARKEHFRQRFENHVTLPQQFKNHGCWAMEFGKMFHRRDPRSWSVPKWIPKTGYAYPIYGKPETVAAQKKRPVARKPKDWWGYEKWVRGVSWEDPDVPDNALFDGQLADKVIEVLRTVRDKRFFLAPGFFRPHLPFIAPKKYYDMYPADSLKLPPNRRSPEGSPAFATYSSAEARQYADIAGKGPIPDAKQLELLRGYYASVSYVDAQIGRVLDALDRLKLREKTTVVLWGDHGYHFGEHGTWNKLTNFEEATRSTLMVSVPGQKNAGAKTDGIVEFVDIYPSLCELSGLPVPRGLEGASFAPLLSDPKRPWKRAAFSEASPRGRHGRSIRTDRYRYVEWRRGDKVVAEELYDHHTDPSENVNVAAAHKELAAKLAARLRAGWRSELPEGVKPM